MGMVKADTEAPIRPTVPATVPSPYAAFGAMVVFFLVAPLVGYPVFLMKALSLGYKADHYKLIAFVLSAALSGLAGGTKTLVFQLASLTDVHWTMSGEVVLMTLLGGLGTVYEPVVGAVLVVMLENYLAQLGAWVTVVQGAIFVVCVLTFRRGIVGELSHLLNKARQQSSSM